jgi:hypothetical protein
MSYKGKSSPLPEWVKSLPETEAAKRENWPPRAKEREIDWERPTFQVYHDPEYDGFAPEFSEARQKLDYTYHRNPAKTRQELQDVILSHVVTAASQGGASKGGEEKDDTNSSRELANNSRKQSQRRPWLVFSAGPMGVGKGYVMSILNEKGLFPLDEFLKIDPDMIKSELPEMAGYLRVDPSSAATKVHRESTQMADVLFEYSLQSRLPTLVDGSLRDVDYYRSLLERVRNDFPEYQLAILHVTASPEIIRTRAKSRAEKTGRAVPTDLLEGSISQVPRSVEALSPFVDITYTISNEDDQPIQLLSARKGKDETTISLSWKDFLNNWYRNVGSDDDGIQGLSDAWCESQCPGICLMAHSYDNQNMHKQAKQIWIEAYPSFCPRCTLVSDAQCGICIHDIHWCACVQCGPASGEFY